ncbi:MAG: Gfo/Idh/MocA family oxidoreductase [Phycisphaerae bacterium]|nr:Gfo/Idh/MocA family oxidoreductase [Phycisphaerae bacterium]
MSQPLRWGILGTGMIAEKFAGQLPDTPRGELAAVGSRSARKSRAFAEQFGGEAREGYEAVLEDDQVDAVYVSLPNGLHHPWTLAALAAGKHVLCEKPLASNAEQAGEIFAAADRAGQVVVEAFMYRLQPAVQRLLEMVREGAIGQPKLVRSNFSFCREASKADARYHADQAGGSLMDVGCYCVNLIRALAGAEPTSVHAVAHRHEYGVDDYAAGTLSFEQGLLGTFTCGMTVQDDMSTFIGGETGSIAMDCPWLSGDRFRVVRDGEEQVIELPAPAGLYAMEAEAFARCVHDGQPAWISSEDTLGNLRVLDEMRRQVGLPV